MKTKVLLLMTCVALATGATAMAQSDEAERIAKATTVFEEIMAVPEKAIPDKILSNADAIAVFPSTLKGGFGFGAHHGKGIVSRRNRDTGTWTAPGFLSLTGGSFGAQIGGQAVDLVLVVMDDRGLQQLLKNQFKIGGDASVAAGPVGRDAEASTDLQMRAKILSYSRTRGLFAGVTLKGSTIRQDRDANERFYGRAYKSTDIVLARLGGAPDPVPAWRDELADIIQ